MMNAGNAQALSLAERVLSGDVQAFEQMMRLHNQRLYRAARSIVKNNEDAQEAVQEAYWKAYCCIGEFRAEASLSTWLTRIVINEALMRLRRIQRRERFFPLGPDRDAANLENMMPITVRSSDHPDQLTWRAELRRLIEHHIDALPESYRTVFVLRAIEDMDTLEVANILGMPEATVRTRYFRARQLMRAALGEEIDACSADAFSFAGHQCDAIVAYVLARIAAANDTNK